MGYHIYWKLEVCIQDSSNAFKVIQLHLDLSMLSPEENLHMCNKVLLGLKAFIQTALHWFFGRLQVIVVYDEARGELIANHIGK